jgi:DNA-binding MarR family transcriptional regulator
MKALFKYHKLAESVDAQPSFKGLDPVQIEILMAIGTSRLNDQMLTVSNILEMTELASPATLHGRLKELRTRGFIEIVSGQDNRFKFLQPSDLANEYFNALDRCIRKAVQVA